MATGISGLADHLLAAKPANEDLEPDGEDEIEAAAVEELVRAIHDKDHESVRDALRALRARASK